FSTVVNADAAIVTDGSSYALEFSDYVLNDDASSGEDLIIVTGQVSSPCFGGELALATRLPLQMDRGSACPTQGEVTVDAGFGPDSLHYSDSGVSIDLSDDGSIDQTLPTCFDPRAFFCPG